MRIEDIDKNFKNLELDGIELKFSPAGSDHFSLSGFPWYEKEQIFNRLPQALIPDTSVGVQQLSWHSSGAQLRFKTNSTCIAVKAKLTESGDMSHMARSGSGGFDLFEGSGVNKRFSANVRQENSSDEIFALFRQGLDKEMSEWTIYFPLYNGVSELEIGLDTDAEIEAPEAFAYEKPILFYGSSITQGGCASRPGNSYTAIITRRLNANMVNWGFSGNGCGEANMAEAIASLDMAAFVLDYDHNAMTPEHLQNTHEFFFKTIREANPDLPIVMVSKPDIKGHEEDFKRREIIRQTWKNAIDAGDSNVYFVDGETLFTDSERDICTVDGCHPNDIGFLRMADGIYPIVKKALSDE